MCARKMMILFNVSIDVGRSEDSGFVIFLRLLNEYVC